jgi:CDP-glucose 4,6-dehydratase
VNYEAFNFGPSTPETHRVIDLLQTMFDLWDSDSKCEFTPYVVTDELPFHEAGLLKLNCDKARFYLKWSSVLDYEETVNYLVSWYKAYFAGELNMSQLTDNQIQIYQEKLMGGLN